MRFTPHNYIDESCKIPLSSLPKTLIKGHQIAVKAFADDQQGYKSNEIVKKTMDHYLLALNEHMNGQVAVRPSPTKSSKTRSTKKTVTTKTKTAATKKKKPVASRKKVTVRPPVTSSVTKVEKLPDEIRFIQRYVEMHGKVRSRLMVRRLLTSLQKAMLEKRIRKSSPYAKEITQIQDQLIRCLNRMGDQADIQITKKYLSHYKEIASSKHIRESVALLKRFVRMHGRENVQNNAERLAMAMEQMVKSGAITKKDPYAQRLNEAYKSLKLYLKENEGAIKVQAGTLNGIHGLLGVQPVPVEKKTSGLSSVVSSEDLMHMDFETIGLQGKFRNLIGDPSVGFTAMVFGQPKSGKSTLMLEFAHHLANHHRDVLYVAFEEGYGYTLKEKITRIGAIHPRLHFAEELPGNLNSYGFVFIDSVSRAGMELQDMIKLKNKYPRTSFIFIFHATKDGKFRGGNELAHEVDVIIEVEDGKASGKGRFGQGEVSVRF